MPRSQQRQATAALDNPPDTQTPSIREDDALTSPLAVLRMAAGRNCRKEKALDFEG
jgi:hypothetical protein